MSTNITFDGFDLQNSSIISSRAQHTQYPDRVIDTQRRSRENDFKIQGNYFVLKRIFVEGILKNSVANDLRDDIDDMKKNLTGEDKNLDIDYGGGTRRYVATVEKLEVEEQSFHITFVKYRVTFLCHAFGQGTTELTRELTGIRSSTMDSEATIAGTAINLPVVRVTVVAETNMVRIKFINTTTNEYIEVETAYNATDVLNINCDTKAVTLNDDPIDFAGVFPTFIAGTNAWTLEVSDSGAFQVNVEIIYYPKYV